MVGAASNDPDLDAVLGVPTGESIEDIDVGAGVEVIDSALAVDLKRVFTRHQPLTPGGT